MFYLELDNPELREVLKTIGKPGDSAAGMVKKCHRWINENISPVQLELDFAGSSEVLREREGDCSEFSVLLTSMLRAGCIPAKVCFGMVFDGRIFCYHFWVEYFDGEWIPIDPINPGGEVDIKYIKLAELNLACSVNAEIALQISPFVHIKRIEIIDSEHIDCDRTDMK